MQRFCVKTSDSKVNFKIYRRFCKYPVFRAGNSCYLYRKPDGYKNAFNSKLLIGYLSRQTVWFTATLKLTNQHVLNSRQI